MPHSANVRSLDSIEAVKAAMQSFAGRVEQAQTMLDTEIRRLLEWLEHDCPMYWKAQINRAHEEVTRAQAALHQCLMYPIADERPSCLEERAALKRTQQRLRYCEEKLELVRHWSRELQRERFEYDGRMNSLSRLVETDVSRGVQLLTQLVRRLEEYQATRTNTGAAAPAVVPLVQELFDDEENERADAATG